MTQGTTMSLSANKLAIIALLTFLAHNSLAEESCPLKHDGKKLIEVWVFDGPPEEMAFLHPRDVGWYFPNKIYNRFNYLECTYENMKQKIVIKLSPDDTACEILDWPKVICH
jgi:hypothetical protein